MKPAPQPRPKQNKSMQFFITGFKCLFFMPAPLTVQSVKSRQNLRQYKPLQCQNVAIVPRVWPVFSFGPQPNGGALTIQAHQNNWLKHLPCIGCICNFSSFFPFVRFLSFKGWKLEAVAGCQGFHLSGFNACLIFYFVLLNLFICYIVGQIEACPAVEVWIIFVKVNKLINYFCVVFF